MDRLAPFADPEIVAPWLMRGLVDGALVEVTRFLLVVVRLSGLMLIGPIFGQASVPWNIRVLLILALAWIITPALPRHLERGFVRLDENRDGSLSNDELPPGLRAPEPEIVTVGTHDPGDVTYREYVQRSVTVPTTLWGLVGQLAGELSVGLLLGLGVFTVLSGLQLAGQLVDQQAGFSLGQIVNPDFDSTGSMSGQSLYLLGLTIFLLLEPISGHLLMLRTLIQTFETLPVGSAFVSFSAVELVGHFVQASLQLGLRVAAPLMVTMSLIDLTLGFLGHSVPQVNIQAVGFSLRAGLCLLFLGLMLSGITDAAAAAILPALESLAEALIAPLDAGFHLGPAPPP